MKGTPMSTMADDRFAIQDVLALYCSNIDRGTVDRMREVYSADAVVDMGAGRGGAIRGVDNIISSIRERQAGMVRTQHQLGQSRIELDGDRATGETYVTAWHLMDDQSTAIARVCYLDIFERIDGRWLIAERRAEAFGVEGFDPEPWSWVNRGVISAK